MRESTVLAAVALILLATAGCAHYGALEADYGNSYNMAKQGQILNPAASHNLAPVTGLAGAAADSAMKKYMESFATSQQCQQGGAQSPLMAPISKGTGQDAYGQK